jgi:hypothetical protein
VSKIGGVGDGGREKRCGKALFYGRRLFEGL